MEKYINYKDIITILFHTCVIVLGRVPGPGSKLIVKQYDSSWNQKETMSFYTNVENPQGQISVPVSYPRRDWLVIYNQPMDSLDTE